MMVPHPFAPASQPPRSHSYESASVTSCCTAFTAGNHHPQHRAHNRNTARIRPTTHTPSPAPGWPAPRASSATASHRSAQSPQQCPAPPAAASRAAASRSTRPRRAAHRLQDPDLPRPLQHRRIHRHEDHDESHDHRHPNHNPDEVLQHPHIADRSIEVSSSIGKDLDSPAASPSGRSPPGRPASGSSSFP